MPRRSNDFQKLVTLIKKHSSSGSTVTESKFLPDRNGKGHEVDIVIAGQVDGIPFIVSIECTEQSRPADDGWVNEMKGKHDRLPTDILILASKNGFTEGARDAAKEFNKRLVTLDQWEDAPTEALLRGLNLLFAKTSSQTVTKVVLGLTALGTRAAEEVEVPEHSRIFSESGEAVGTVQQLAVGLLRLPNVLQSALKQCEDHHTKFSVCVSDPKYGNGHSIFYRRDELHPLRMVGSVIISGRIQVTTVPVPIFHGKLENTVVAWGKAEVQGKPALFVVSKNQKGETKGSLDVGGETFRLHEPIE
jgi:hypothetical protein